MQKKMVKCAAGIFPVKCFWAFSEKYPEDINSFCSDFHQGHSWAALGFPQIVLEFLMFTVKTSKHVYKPSFKVQKLGIQIAKDFEGDIENKIKEQKELTKNDHKTFIEHSEGCGDFFQFFL